jgi:transcriptional regulator with XRE-family HTH domain
MGSDDSERIPGMMPEQRVGAAMREARESAGISLRGMAKRLGYHSHTMFSSYERGAAMPTDDAVTGYERVLGLSPGTLTSVLEEARTQRHGDPFAKRQVYSPVEFIPKKPDGQDPLNNSSKLRWFHNRWVAILSAVVILSLVVLVVNLLIDQSRSSHLAASSVIGVRDGSDPKVTGCAAGAVTADSVDIYDPAEHLVGVLQLRDSARCGTSWGRFIPTSTLPTEPKLTLEIDVERPADGAASRFRVIYDGLPAYGNMLISRHECVYTQLTLMRVGQPRSSTFQTPCRQALSG